VNKILLAVLEFIGYSAVIFYSFWFMMVSVNYLFNPSIVYDNVWILLPSQTIHLPLALPYDILLYLAIFLGFLFGIDGYYNRRNLENADEMLKVNPKDIESLLTKAEALENLHFYDDALHIEKSKIVYKEVLYIDPENQRAKQGLDKLLKKNSG
jgi:hypothetical protein